MKACQILSSEAPATLHGHAARMGPCGNLWPTLCLQLTGSAHMLTLCRRRAVQQAATEGGGTPLSVNEELQRLCRPLLKRQQWPCLRLSHQQPWRQSR